MMMNGQLTQLRELTKDDADSVYALLGDDTVTKWLAFDSRTLDDCREMLRGIESRAASQPRAEYYFGIVVNSKLIGFIRLGLTGTSAAKIGYAVRTQDWGHGYATDAVQAMLRFGFTELNLHRISAAVGPVNYASLAVLKKAGMVGEGRIRDHVFTNGEWRDSLLYSILKREWRALAGSAAS